ncbi:Peroxidase, family 2-domain-containing protein [Paraphoma chrysanthemicola]|uniref:Peroxidase, family 2-domain-containing protein n=1 Tax=Paraphoma chrysanthemicola TaxID=798071 RepID=A0A8K0VXV1_9PLEO|nr:Peroxidase, family 2-domain-containing protein [Paraphoma chrysanthemicola]
MVLLQSLISVLGLCALAMAQVDFRNWERPGPGDIRGPCPAMNSLANHHILPHDGKNLTVPVIADALGKAFNLSLEMGTIVASIGLATAPDPSLGFFNLNHLNKHNAFEHDASLSRVDYYFSGDEGIAKFDNETFNRWFSHFDGLTYIDIDIAAKARYAMVQYSRAHTPGLTYEEQHQITICAETIKFFKTMINSTGKCRRDFLKILFATLTNLLQIRSRCIE